MKSLSGIVAFGIVLLIAGCVSTPPAPVIERAPQKRKQEAPASVQPATTKAGQVRGADDQRPDVYIVKKGDTLYSIGLESGFDYKEIAQHNGLQPPYTIHLGQPLRLPVTEAAKPVALAIPLPIIANPVGGVPLLSDPKASRQPYSAQAMTDGTTTEIMLKQQQGRIDNPAIEPGVVAAIPLFNEPRAFKEPYSVQALAAGKDMEGIPGQQARQSTVEKPAEAPGMAAAKVETPPEKSSSPVATDDEAVEWMWPTSGKMLTGFNQSANAKGIDIGGVAGQAIYAAASGKVVYSGTGLRGYGKLIIIKHNKTYLSAYAHNSKIFVKEGQEIAKGQKISEMGNTDTESVKLHFEIRRIGKPVDPMNYLPASN